MALKKVRVELKQGSGFRTECRAGRHSVVIDQPSESGGSDGGPTPLDFELIALGGCITAVARIIAMQKRMPLMGIEVALEGELDTDGLLGKTTGGRMGFESITARVRIDADIPPAEKEDLLRKTHERCPVSDNLENGTPVKIVLDL